MYVEENAESFSKVFIISHLFSPFYFWQICNFDDFLDFGNMNLTRKVTSMQVICFQSFGPSYCLNNLLHNN